MSFLNLNLCVCFQDLIQDLQLVHNDTQLNRITTSLTNNQAPEIDQNTLEIDALSADGPMPNLGHALSVSPAAAAQIDGLTSHHHHHHLHHVHGPHHFSHHHAPPPLPPPPHHYTNSNTAIIQPTAILHSSPNQPTSSSSGATNTNSSTAAPNSAAAPISHFGHLNLHHNSD